MKELYNKTILVGREPANSRLCLAINTGKECKITTIGQKNSVPQSVSRCIPADNSGHCKIEIDHTGSIRITNMKESNSTYINGNEVVSKTVSGECTVALGCEKYSIGMKEILSAAEDMLKGKVPELPRDPKVPEKPEIQDNGKKGDETYSIAHLEKVWDEFRDKQQQLQNKQKKINLLKSLYLPISASGGLILLFAPAFDLGSDTTKVIQILVAITSLAVLAIGLYKSATDKSAAKKEKLNDWLIDNYTCPNPECRHFLGSQPYKIIKQHKNCPYCKSKYTAN
jgi:hypothetical protein